MLRDDGLNPTCEEIISAPMSMLLDKLKRLPIWPALILYVALLYIICFYELEKPYPLFHCQENDIGKCSYFFKNLLLQVVLRDFALIGIPGLIVMYVGRRSLKFLGIWSACFTAWTYMTATGTGGVDGKNGCIGCEFGVGAMAAFSVIAFMGAMFLAFERSMMRRYAKRPASH